MSLCNSSIAAMCYDLVVECPDVLCEIFCPYGFEYDKNDCQLCECHNPCAVSSSAVLHGLFRTSCGQ